MNKNMSIAKHDFETKSPKTDELSKILSATRAFGEHKPLPRANTSNIAYECNDKKAFKRFMDRNVDPDHHLKRIISSVFVNIFSKLTLYN